MVVSPEIKTGLNLTTDPSTTALKSPIFFFLNCFMNVIITIASFTETPKRIRVPTRDGTLILVWVIRSIRTTPITARGKENITMKGSLKDSN